MLTVESFLPNPAGKDAEGEVVTLRNTGTETVDLAGFSLSDASGKTFYLSGSLGPGNALVLPYATTKLQLNNTGETVRLTGATGAVVDELSYAGTAADGQIITRAAAEQGTETAAAGAAVSPALLRGSTVAEPMTALLVAGVLLAAAAVIAAESLAPEHA